MKGNDAAKEVGKTADQGDDDGEEEEGALLEEDDYTAHQKWQSQTKLNLQCVCNARSLDDILRPYCSLAFS
jgi:hypothetical protein